jgi:hypothetical protein
MSLLATINMWDCPFNIKKVSVTFSPKMKKSNYFDSMWENCGSIYFFYGISDGIISVSITLRWNGRSNSRIYHRNPPLHWQKNQKPTEQRFVWKSNPVVKISWDFPFSDESRGREPPTRSPRIHIDPVRFINRAKRCAGSLGGDTKWIGV